MSAVVPFPRAKRLDADLSRDALLRRCRVDARIEGCNEVQRATVAAAAGVDFDGGKDPGTLRAIARKLARALARGRR